MEGRIAGFRPWFMDPVNLSTTEGKFQRDELLNEVCQNILFWATQGERIILVTPKYKCIIENHPKYGEAVKCFDVIRQDGIQQRWNFWFNRSSVLYIKDLLTPDKRRPDFDQLLVM